jgi:type VI secretion system protein ImpH
MAAESRLEGPGLTGPDEPVETIDLDAVMPAPTGAAAAGARREARALFAEIERLLREQPHSFGFFQAVRQLERLYPDKTPVGGFGDPAAEVVRFGVLPTLAFPASEIQELELNETGPSMMRVNFMGLTGPQGVLPHVYTLLAQERLRSRDSALVDFLDLFHHRLLSLFYQAWRKYRFTLASEEGVRDALHDHLLDLIGLGSDVSRGRMPMPDEALAYRAGLLVPQARSAGALQQLIEDYFDVPVEVEQFVGAWYTLSEPDRCAIGDENDAARLGGAVVGEEVWDAQARIRVRLGPLGRSRYDAFLPGGTAHRELAGLVGFFCHAQFEVELQLVLKADEVPGLRLGDDAAMPLGWSTWIRSAPGVRDGDETLLLLEQRAAS